VRVRGADDLSEPDGVYALALLARGEHLRGGGHQVGAVEVDDAEVIGDQQRDCAVDAGSDAEVASRFILAFSF
jgi:hypothetical protein